MPPRKRPNPAPKNHNPASAVNDDGPRLPPEVLETVLGFLPTSELVRVSCRLCKDTLVRMPALLRQRFNRGVGSIRVTFACGWSRDSDSEASESEEEPDIIGRGAYVLNGTEFFPAENPWIGDYWSGPGHEMPVMSVLERAHQRLDGIELYKGQPTLLPASNEALSLSPKKRSPTFRQLLRSFYSSMRVSFIPKEPFRVFAAYARFAPSSVFVALVDTVKELTADGKPRRHLTGNPGWWDEFQVVESDPNGIRTIPPLLPLEDVETGPLHVELGVMHPLAAAGRFFDMPASELAKVATPRGAFAIPFPVADFNSDERRRFKGVTGGLTFRGWAGEMDVQTLSLSRFWVLEITEVQVSLMVMARKLDLEEKEMK